MLTVYLYVTGEPITKFVPPEFKIIDNPDTAFDFLKFDVDSIDKKLVRVIDEGELIDRFHFVDRFGTTLYTRNLSTGSKTALLVNNVDDVVDLCECGNNAVNVILSCCNSGKVAMTCPLSPLVDYTDGKPVEISVNGTIFTNIRDLSKHFTMEV